MAKSKETSDRQAVRLPRAGTRAAYDYFASWKSIERFFDWVLRLVARVEVMAEKAHKVLHDIESDETRKGELKRQWEARRSMTDELRDQRQFFLEVILVRHVENFLSYLAALLHEIFTQRPETLRSSDKVEVANVLRHESIESLVREMAERKVESLSYSSFDDLAEFFRDRFNLDVVTAEELPLLKQAIETRNISVHNRCRINKRFVARTGCPMADLGKVRELYIHDLDQLVPALVTATKRLDQAAWKDLRLKGIRFAKNPTADGTTVPVPPQMSEHKREETRGDATAVRN
jgi:hypothetical protein